MLFRSQFFAYHIMPTSARILSLDSCTTLFKAFRIMNDNLVSSAFMWDRDEELYKAILTATDVMKACIAFYHGYLSPAPKFSLAEARERLGCDPGTALRMSDILSRVSIRSVKAPGARITFAQT